MSVAPLPRYLLDTNILVAYVRAGDLGRRIEARYSLTATPTAAIISVVCEGEIRSLALQFAWGAARLRQLHDVIGQFVSVPLEYPGLLDAYAEIDHLSRQLGRPMGENDVWIAAAARATNARLLTTDRDFDHLHPTMLQRDWIDPASRP
jgi:tRNA(fMet)-specific endonuclease VapC